MTRKGSVGGKHKHCMFPHLITVSQVQILLNGDLSLGLTDHVGHLEGRNKGESVSTSSSTSSSIIISTFLVVGFQR